MVTFLPFSGYRPALKPGESIENRISPPYDVIDDAYLAELKGRDNNVTHLTLSPDGDRRYHGARRELDRMIADGSLKQDTDSFYLYEQTFDDKGTKRTRTGLMGILKTEDYSEGNVIPHEETFSKVKEDRLNLLRDMEAHLESIFGIHEGLSPELNKKIADSAKLLYRYTDSQGVEHRYSRICDQEIMNGISDQLSNQKMLIADGHHRYETALNYSRENPEDAKKGYVLATLVSSDDAGLVIWPTHRLVKSDEIAEHSAVKRISERMLLEKVTEEDMEDRLGDWMMGLMFKSGNCYLARYENAKDPIWNLDTYVAQEIVLKGVYKQDEGKSEVAYDAEFPSVKTKMSEKRYDLAIVLNDPELQTIWDLSMIGKRMPKKTTFFFPKIWSGFVFYKMS